MKLREGWGFPWPQYPAFLSYDRGFKGECGAASSFNQVLKVLVARSGIPVTGRVTSQGLKASSLWWAAKYGLDPSDCTRLGYHKIPGETSSTRTYAREPLAAPVAKLTEVFRAIRQGRFDPLDDSVATAPLQKSQAADEDFEQISDELCGASEDSESDGKSEASLHNTESQCTDDEH